MKNIDNMDKKRIKASKFGNLLLFVIAYVLLSVVIRDIALTDKNIKIVGFEITTSALRGIITQIQMLISVYKVLKENKMGYIAKKEGRDRVVCYKEQYQDVSGKERNRNEKY